MVRVGVLALQGDLEAHACALARVGAGAVAVRKPAQLDGCEALVLPGGESTAMLRGIERDGLEAPLRTFLASGRPVLGTCAGAILLAHGVTPAQWSFDALDVDVERNAYGTQLDSFATVVDVGAASPDAEAVFERLPAVFIRAPRIVRVGPSVEVLARVRGDPVLVHAGPIWAATFHPELTEDDRVLRRWAGLAQDNGRVGGVGLASRSVGAEAGE
jgi:5'-phosphate synthase pdxT subunit